jgi:hypothetical protein
MTVDPTRSSRATRQGSRPAAGAGRHRQGLKGGVVGSPVVRRCSKQGVRWWTRRLLLWRTHLWPYRDGAGPGIVEGWPRRGAPAVIVVVVAGAIVLAFPLPLALTPAFATVVGVGAGRGRAA